MHTSSSRAARREVMTAVLSLLISVSPAIAGAQTAPVQGPPLEEAGAEQVMLSERGKPLAPRVFVLDGVAVARVKGRLAEPHLATQMQALRDAADAMLLFEPVSVMDKPTAPPSGDKHDYMSLAPYNWPNPDSPDGQPYVKRDGEINPEREKYDGPAVEKMSDAVGLLATAWYFTEDERYAAHAARLLRVWFLDEATRMNPHLQYGQAVPGGATGRNWGIIETRHWIQLVDMVGLLESSDSWTSDDHARLQAWFDEYLRWLLTSEFGRREDTRPNNHGAWYVAQTAAYALFVGKQETARRILAAAGKKRFDPHIDRDGKMPLELARTRAFTYTAVNLTALVNLARLADHVDIDLWNFRGDQGQGLRNVFTWFAPFVAAPETWRYPQITEITRLPRLSGLYRLAANAYDEPEFEQVVAEIVADGDALAWLDLCYPRRGD